MQFDELLRRTYMAYAVPTYAILALLCAGCGQAPEDTTSQIAFLQDLERRTSEIMAQHRATAEGLQPGPDPFMPGPELLEQNQRTLAALEKVWRPHLDGALEDSRTFRWMVSWAPLPEDQAWEITSNSVRNSPYPVVARLLWKGEQETLEVGFQLKKFEDTWRVVGFRTSPNLEIRRKGSAEDFARDYTHSMVLASRADPWFLYSLNEHREAGWTDTRERTRALLVDDGGDEASREQALEGWQQDPGWSTFGLTPWEPPTPLRVQSWLATNTVNPVHTKVRVRFAPGGDAYPPWETMWPLRLDLVQQDGLWCLASLPAWPPPETVIELHRDAASGQWNYAEPEPVK